MWVGLNTHTHTGTEQCSFLFICSKRNHPMIQTVHAKCSRAPSPSKSCSCVSHYIYHGVSVLRRWSLNFIFLYAPSVKYLWACTSTVYIFLSSMHVFVPNCVILSVKLNFFLTFLDKNKCNHGHTFRTIVGHLSFINGLRLPGSLRHLTVAPGSLMSLSLSSPLRNLLDSPPITWAVLARPHRPRPCGLFSESTRFGQERLSHLGWQH